MSELLKIIFMGPLIVTSILILFLLYKKFNYITIKGYRYINVIILLFSIVGYIIYNNVYYIVAIITTIICPSVDLLTDVLFNNVATNISELDDKK